MNLKTIKIMERKDIIGEINLMLLTRVRNKVLFTPYALVTSKKFGYYPTDLENCPKVKIGRKDYHITKIFLTIFTAPYSCKDMDVMMECHDDNGKHTLKSLEVLNDDNLQTLYSKAQKIYTENVYHKDIPIDKFEFHGEPTHAECAAGYGCTHYKSFQMEYLYKDDGLFKRRVADFDGRIWTR